MAVKRTGQLSLAEAFLGGKALGVSGALDRIGGLVKWYRFEKLLAGLRDDGPGRPGWPALVLYRALLVQSLYGLSDRALEEALADRLSFRRFVGLGLEETVPDHSVISRFRNELVARRLLERLFAELDRQLEEAGVMVKRGTMLDATLIEAASAPGSGARSSRDADAAFGGKKGGFIFGYKAHVGVDRGSGLIRAVETTPANINDTTPADGLIRGDEAEVYADAAYDTHARRTWLADAGIKPRIARRPNAPSAARAPQALQPAHRPAQGRRRNNLRHPQTAHAPHPHPLCRPRQGGRPGHARRNRFQHETMGRYHAIAASKTGQTAQIAPHQRTTGTRNHSNDHPQTSIPTSRAIAQQAPQGGGGPAGVSAEH